ncbi:hypothetical protein R3F74_32820 [Bradyrhizobium japonicum]|uniref:hypothetical protein n=1 Tax=Bradyrhizobium japonicum TaxID=375 RepID=UPI002B45B707|nr:hypothetical protein [Bradyrhizobium japonicum]WRJ72104.1 hypothetical protein R3F74_32820 [Bradyrhizobium japonicum]
MNTSIVPAPAGKRGRYSSVILTNHLCEKRVAKRLKLYDRKCPGLYVSITTAGVATFSFKFTDRQTGKQRTGWLGIYNPETFTVEDARSKVYGLKAMGGEALAETFRDQKAAKAKRGKTVSDIIDERITWMKTLVKKPDGEMRPRLESWENTASPPRPPHPPSPRQEAGHGGHQARHRHALERHRCGQVRQALGQQRPPHAQGSLRPVQLGGRGRPRLRDRQPLR